MKKFLTLRNILICGGAFLAILVFIFSFVAAFRVTSSNGTWSEYQGIVWGARTIKFSDGSSETAAPQDAIGAVVLPLIGAILFILAGLGSIVLVLFGDKFLSEQVKKIGFIVCGGLLVLGGIFTFFTAEGFIANVAAKAGGTAQQVKDMWAALNAKTSCGLPIVSGILAILGGGAICASQFVPDKQF